MWSGQAEDLVGALAWVSGFVGNAPVVGHNVGFDLGFLNHYSILQNNLRLDTFELASAMMPRAPRYALGSLAAHVNLDLERAHRALDDARATGLLYAHLWEKVLQLPDLDFAGDCLCRTRLKWDAAPIFEAALRERGLADEPPRISDEELIHRFGRLSKEETAETARGRQADLD